jgi:7-cyano-7-deazaguanine synthase
MTKKAIILLSGGLDSATCVAEAQRAGFEVHALSFRYGQRHAVELDAAQLIARQMHVSDHRIIDIDLRQFGGSALTADIDVPKARNTDAMADGIPITYVPARNTIFLSFALAWGEVLPATDFFIGVNALDYSGYPDCRPAFIEAFQAMANLGTQAGVEGDTPITIHTPLKDMTKADIVARGTSLGVDYSLTISCYDPDETGAACGDCDSCLLRRKGFAQAGVADPTRYADTP